MMRFIAVLALALLALSSFGQAQEGAAGLAPGQRVRVTLGNGAEVVGIFISADTGRMRVLTAPLDTAWVDRAAARSVEMSVGRQSKTLVGALIGAPLGALGAATVAWVAVGTPALDSGDEELAVVAVAAMGGFLLGGVGGALIGSKKRSDIWEPTIWPTISVSPAGPDGKAVAFGVHLRF